MADSSKNKACNSGVNQYVGREIRKLRREKKLSLESVAKELGITHQQLGKYERGEVRIVAEILFELAHIFNVSFDRFFPTVFVEKTTSSQILEELEVYPEEIQKAYASLLRSYSKFIQKNYQKIANR